MSNTIKFITKLNESFRDTDNDIDIIENEIYNLINSYDSYWYGDIEEYTPDEEWYEDDLAKLNELRNKYIELKSKRENEYIEELKSLPQPTDKRDFEGFDITKSDPSFAANILNNPEEYDYQVNKKQNYNAVYIAEVTPEQYIELCIEYGWKQSMRGKSIQYVYDQLGNDSHEKIHAYAERMKNDEKAPTPYIDIKRNEQEGRHRAFAAMEAGIQTIPVIILC